MDIFEGHFVKVPTCPPDLVNQWLRALSREGIEDLKNIYVCAKHFLPEDIETNFSIPQLDGSVLEIQRTIPKLRKNAIPRVLPNCPSYFSSSSHSKPQRLDRSARDDKLFFIAVEQSLGEFRVEEEQYKVTTLQELVSKRKPFDLPKQWTSWSTDATSLHFIKPCIMKNSIFIACSLTITDTLHTIGCRDGQDFLLSLPTINDIRHIDILLEELDQSSTTAKSPDIFLELANASFQHHVNEATRHIQRAIELLTASPDNDSTDQLHVYLVRLQFILCQLENSLISKHTRKYDIETLIVALKCQLISPIGYKFLQSLDCLSLPHHSTLNRLYSNFGLDIEFINYLKQSTKEFNNWERNVIIQMDEIHVKSTFTYKGGRILGTSVNPNDPAKTVFAFMVSSLSRKWSTIVRLLPCTNSSATELLPTIKSVIEDVESCGLFVQVLCTDNYPMNVNIFKLFSPTHALDPIVPHPNDPKRPLFLLFDFVHIIKSVRNNWLNQKDYNKTFIYPNFEDFSITNSAILEDVRLLYKDDQHSVAKLAPKLTSKSCWPSTFERQNVNLALRIFDDSTAAALNLVHLSRQISTNSQTADFISTICKVWKIFNVNTPNKGILLKDDFSKPISSNDPRFSFLERVIKWAECWKALPSKNGKLSSQTFSSLRHSCIALSLIVNHLTQNCGFLYVLSSFLQNDPLEHHFGIYRMMSGAQYHVSFCQILESERRLKLSSILKLFSRKSDKDKTSLKEFLDTCSPSCYTESISNLNLDSYMTTIQDYSEIELHPPILQALSFIAGYAVHVYYKHSSKCTTCLSLLTEIKDMEFEEPSDSKYKLIQIIDRGSLKWPSNSVIEAIVIVWKVISSIENNLTLMDNFMTGPSRSILVSLSTTIIENEYAEFWRGVCKDCGILRWNILAKLLTSTSNCILSNKVKNLNALQADKKDNTRKLKKLKSN